jgi:ABC-type branched-subunit amino acid transport system substrate-binding protein
MNRKVVPIILILLLFCSVGWAAETIKIGSLSALTGGFASFGPPIDYGVKLAATHINWAQGIFGRQIEIITRDTATDPAVGRDAASKLVQVDRVPAAVGALSSDVTVAASSVTIAEGLVMISPASTSPQLTGLDDNDLVFRTCPSDTVQGLVQATVAADQGFKTASVIYVNNPYGKALEEAFKASFEQKGGKVLTTVRYEEQKASYKVEVDSAIEEKPDVLNVIAYPADGNKLLVEAAELGHKGRYIFSDSMKGDEVSGGPAKDYLEGCFGTAPGAIDLYEVELFENDYKSFLSQQGLEKDEIAKAVTRPFRMEAYDAMSLIAYAMVKEGPQILNMSPKEQAQAIRENIRDIANPPGTVVKYNQFADGFDWIQRGNEINYEGVSGPITFDRNGDLKEATIEIWTVKDGKTVRVRTVSVE